MQNPILIRKAAHSRPARGLAVVCVACAISFVGCTAEVETARPVVASDDSDLIEVETAPADVYSYPHTEYRGRVVYFVNGRWYYPSGRRWYYYRTEPSDLVRHRRYIETAPPARSPSVAPPAYGPPRPYAPPTYAPPPATPAPGEAVRVH